MSAESAFDRIHRAGYGITVNLWAESEDYAVELWRNGQPAASGRGHALEDALVEAEGRIAQGRLL